MNAGYAHEIRVGMDAADGLDRRRANGNDGVLEQLATDQDHFYISILEQLQGYGWAVGDYSGSKFRGKMARNLYRGCSSVKDNYLTRLHHCGRRFTDHFFLVRRQVEPRCKVTYRRRCRKCSSMDPLQETFRCQ